MQRGFTLMEVLIAIALFAFIVGGTIISFTNLLEDQTVKRTVNDIASYIEEARARTLAGEYGRTYGIVFATTTVSIVRGPEYSVASSTTITHTLPNNVEMISYTLGSTTLTFDVLTGDASVNGGVMYAHTRNASTTGSVTIERTGIVSVE